MTETNVTILTPHWVSTTENSVADFLTHHRILTWEFKLNPILFNTILTHFNLQPTLDAFALKETHQLTRFMSWNAEASAVGRDALLCPWDPVTYCFPPVPLIPKVTNKVKKEKLEVILVCPAWPTSLWYLQVVKMMVSPPFPLPTYKQALIPVGQDRIQVFLDPLVAVHISGRV